MNDLWIDADVLLRLLTGDPPALARKALALAKKAEADTVRLHVSPLVLAEVAWTLTSYYGYSRDRVAEILLPLLAAKGLELEEEHVVTAAVEDMASKDVDFLDAYLAQQARARGGAVCSFDPGFERLDIERVSPG